MPENISGKYVYCHNSGDFYYQDCGNAIQDQFWSVPVFKWVKTVNALDIMATVIGF
jgi:hypothetical protein